MGSRCYYVPLCIIILDKQPLLVIGKSPARPQTFNGKVSLVSREKRWWDRENEWRYFYVGRGDFNLCVLKY
jgi:hypothetical protein